MDDGPKMFRRVLLGIGLSFALWAQPLLAEPAAQLLFGAVRLPATPDASGLRVIGSYARGCMAGATQLPRDGPGWQVMRLSRNRAWGQPELVGWVEWFAGAALQAGWPGLLIGDMAQPRGGPMVSGHASHQLGLDVDIWFTPMPDHVLSLPERETISARSMLLPGTRVLDESEFGPTQLRLLEAAAASPEVTRIFVHPAIKAAACDWAGPHRAWLEKLRPWWGHDDHFHVRLACPSGEPLCRDQDPPPDGDGCGKELAWWLSEEPWVPKPPSVRRPISLADLPAQCRAVLAASPALGIPPAAPLAGGPVAGVAPVGAAGFGGSR